MASNPTDPCCPNEFFNCGSDLLNSPAEERDQRSRTQTMLEKVDRVLRAHRGQRSPAAATTAAAVVGSTTRLLTF